MGSADCEPTFRLVPGRPRHVSRVRRPPPRAGAVSFGAKKNPPVRAGFVFQTRSLEALGPDRRRRDLLRRERFDCGGRRVSLIVAAFRAGKCGGRGAYSGDEIFDPWKHRFYQRGRRGAHGRLLGAYRAGHTAIRHPNRRPWNGGLPNSVHRGRPVHAAEGQMTDKHPKRPRDPTSSPSRSAGNVPLPIAGEVHRLAALHRQRGYAGLPDRCSNVRPSPSSSG
jgi:hypothetical protein